MSGSYSIGVDSARSQIVRPLLRNCFGVGLVCISAGTVVGVPDHAQVLVIGVYTLTSKSTGLLVDSGDSRGP
jgi:hypothetical protein